ncbi:MAG: acyl-CoA reductase [Polyangiaceae bacterium]
MIDEQARIEILLAIARRVRDPSDPLGEEVRRELLARGALSALSAQGVELALREHLEITVSAQDFERLLASVPRARSGRAIVVLSAHVPVAPVRALALALAAADEVVVKPSRRDPALATILVRELSAAGLSVSLATSVDARAGDLVFVYGSAASIEAVAASLPAGAELEPHGPGFGVAVVSRDADLAAAASKLARDVVPFDQRGCLSPRIAFVEGDDERARAFALALDHELTACGDAIPRGQLASDERELLARWLLTMRAIGEVFEGSAHAIAVDSAPTAIELPPAARVIVVYPYSTHAVLLRLLAPLRAHLTTLGLAGEDDALRIALSSFGARVTELGWMQRPPLDGPVDTRRLTLRKSS